MKLVILKNLGMSKISSNFMAQLHCNRWPHIADCSMFLRRFSNLTGTHLRNIKKSVIYDHLLQCNCAINFDDFSILAMDSNMFKLLLRESLLLKWTNLFETGQYNSFHWNSLIKMTVLFPISHDCQMLF